MRDPAWNMHRDGSASNWSVGGVLFLVILINTLRLAGLLQA